MELNFITDPTQHPRPREEIRIQSVKLAPYPDGRRVRVEIDLTPFGPSDRPNLQITATHSDGTEAASIHIVETMHRSISLTAHLRHPGTTDGKYIFTTRLFYDPAVSQDVVETQLTLNSDEPSTK